MNPVPHVNPDPRASADPELEPVLRVQGVSARYGRQQVLNEVSFELPASSIMVLLGPNGAGKSTLLRLILGLHEAREGRVLVTGLDVAREASAVRRRVGFVPDKPDAYPWMRLDELFRFLKPQYPSWSDERALRLAEEMQVPLRRKFQDLSRGQGTKAMLAAALAIEPALLILDEPFGPLDPAARDELVRGLLGGIAAKGCGVLIATHDLHMAARIADRVVMLGEGVVRASGPIEEVLGVEEEGNQLPTRLKGLFDVGSPERMRSA